MKDEFEQAGKEAQPGLVREFIDFIAHNKKWWMIPLIAAILGLGALVWLGGTGAAPFIYTLF
jgi:hypothetical protein